VVVTDSLVSSGDFELVDVHQIDQVSATCVPTSGLSVGQRLDITCQLAALESSSPSNAGRWTIEMVARADSRQDVNNLAEVLSDQLDPDASNNAATAGIKVRPPYVSVGGVSLLFGRPELVVSWLGLVTLVISGAITWFMRRRRH
jgi:hypothetical protein